MSISIHWVAGQRPPLTIPAGEAATDDYEARSQDRIRGYAPRVRVMGPSGGSYGITTMPSFSAGMLDTSLGH